MATIPRDGLKVAGYRTIDGREHEIDARVHRDARGNYEFTPPPPRRAEAGDSASFVVPADSLEEFLVRVDKVNDRSTPAATLLAGCMLVIIGVAMFASIPKYIGGWD